MVYYCKPLKSPVQLRKSGQTPRRADANASQSSYDDLSLRSAAQGNADKDTKVPAGRTQMRPGLALQDSEGEGKGHRACAQTALAG